MKKNNIKEKSSSKLKSELKDLTNVTRVLIGVLILLVLANLYGLIMKDNNTTFIAGIAVAIALSAILPTQFKNIKEIKAELELRDKIN